MNTVEFKSNIFPKYPNEDEEIINPNRWGKKLAEWVSEKLPDEGIKTEEIFPEDWGWLVNLKIENFNSFLGCGIIDGAENEFLILIEVKQPFFKRLFNKKDPKPIQEKIKKALDSILKKEKNISEIKWECS